ncbi:RNA polymerase sigma factor [Terrabacter sp. 2RAF25]|uniref:RNA polymerase sigma factor n=1 Tax=Terrabacter sp. 2RAF25 TaxID=3232998 RepID=UPI003F9EA859
MNAPGDYEAFEEFVRLSLPTLTRAASALCGDAHLAQDLVQETHIRIARHWRRIARSDDDVLPYARKVLYRLWLDSRRWRARHPEQLTDPSGSSPTADEAENVATRLALASALAQLSPSQRAAVVLRFLEGRREAEVADILNLSVPSVHSLLRRALVELRKCYPEFELR